MAPSRPLKTKVSSWESFLKLFSPETGRVNLVIPTRDPYTPGVRVLVKVFLPDEQSLNAVGVVLQAIRTPEGKQRGVGVTLSGIDSGQEARLSDLRQRAMAPDSPPPRTPQTARTPAAPPSHRVTPVPQKVSLEPSVAPADEQFIPEDQHLSPLDPHLISMDAPSPAPPPAADDQAIQPIAMAIEVPADEPLQEAPLSPPAPQEPPQLEVQVQVHPTGPPARVSFDQAPPELDPPPDAHDPAPAEQQMDDYTFPHPGLMETTPIPTPPIVGMDLGTTRSSVAVVENNEVLVLQSPSGQWDIPSVVGYTESGEPVVGTDAREMLIIDPSHAIMSPKRLLGRLHQERDLEPYLAGMAMPHSEGPHGEVQLHPRGGTVTLPQVCAPLLANMRAMAEEYLQRPVNEVVLTIPVSYDDMRRGALQEAARIAGLRVVDFIEEPTAAVLAHHFDDQFQGLIAVYDFGGGTFDFSLVEVGQENVDVISTAGDTWLGGDDFDLALASAAANAFWRETQIEIRNQVVRWQRLLIASEKAKRELSTHDETVLALPDAAITAEGPLSLRFPCTRALFNDICTDLVERSLETCRETLEIQQIDPSEVETVYLSGGTSAIPAIQDALTGMFGKPPRMAIPPERAVVIGAALQAANLHQRRSSLRR